MVSTVVLATAVGGGLVLLAAGVGHVRRFAVLRANLVSQALLPYRWHRPVAQLLVIAELVVGVAVVVAGLAPRPGWRIAFAVEGALYLALLGYAVTLRSRRPAAPCGCFGDDGPSSRSSLVRTGTLAIGATLAAAVTATRVATPLPLLLAGALTIAALAYVVPSALRTVNSQEATWTH
jgi:hypothetical protein